MKKTTIIILSACIIIFLAIATIFIFSKKNNEQIKFDENLTKVQNIYENICKSKEFTFSMEEKNSEINYEVDMAQKGSDFCIDMHSEDEHTTTVVMGNESYYIMHNDKEYYNFGSEDIEPDLEIYGLENLINNEYNTGNETINGKEYYYEEYQNDGSDFIIYADLSEESEVRTRFYFDNNELVYIKSIIQDGENKQEELFKAKLEYKVDEKLFEIPSDYKEIVEEVDQDEEEEED